MEVSLWLLMEFELQQKHVGTLHLTALHSLIALHVFMKLESCQTCPYAISFSRVQNIPVS